MTDSSEPSNPMHRIETTLRVAESLFSISITLIDNNGLFHAPGEVPLIGTLRQSHKKNRACRLVHCTRCTDHCRHWVTAEGEALRKPFVHVCWAGLTEVVVPLIWRGQHVGSLFAGLWRDRTAHAPRKSSDDFRMARGMLDTLDTSRAEDLIQLLPWLADGLLRDLDAALGIPVDSQDIRTLTDRFLAYRAHQDIRLADLARELHRSPSRTSHIVQELYGQSFREKLKQVRIKRAKSLLRETDQPVAEIARSVGMPDRRYFARAFKSITGVPPTTWRKQNQAREKTEL